MLSKQKELLIFLLIRIMITLFYIPIWQNALFYPFVNEFSINLSLDPWANWLESGGRTDAFPYGWYMLIPLAIPHILQILFTPIGFFNIINLIPIVLLIFELIIFLYFKINRSEEKMTLWFIALSPLLLYVTYFHGQLDIIPTTFFFLSIILLRYKKWQGAGAFLGLAIGAKLSFIVVLPFILVFAVQNRRFLRGFTLFFSSLSLLLVPTLMYILFSEGYRKMVIGTPESLRLFYYNLEFNENIILYIYPLTYLLLIFILFKLDRTTIQVLTLFLTATLFLLALLAGDAIGWYIWIIPLIALILKNKSKLFYFAVIFFQIATILLFAQSNSTALIRSSNHIVNKNFLSVTIIDENIHLFTTIYIALSILLIYSIFRNVHELGDKYQFSDQPISWSIAGDSGVGKDTLSMNLAKAVGKDASIIIQGDNYHLYERNAQTWKYFTHLNPKMNDLQTFEKDFLLSIKRKEIISRHYDHNNGTFTSFKKSPPADFVIVNGLHALIPIAIINNSDVKIFLEMDENLRVKLKLERDNAIRWQSIEDLQKKIQTRKSDSAKYIIPQKNLADLCISIKPFSQLSDINEESFKERFLVDVYFKDLLFGKALYREIQKYPSIDIDLTQVTFNEYLLTINPIGLFADDFKNMAKNLITDWEQLFTNNIELEGGHQGFITLVAIMAAAEKRLTRRR